MRRRKALLVCFVAAVFVAGCSTRVTGPQNQTRDIGGMIVTAGIRPGLPQDSVSAPTNASAQTGDNTLVVSLRDASTNAPIGDANIAAAPSSSLVGNESSQSGRAQGNGIYFVPIRFAVPDTYKVTVTIDRSRKPESAAQFTFTVS